jgi:ectoine hydroxylase-related dioxygenase (phytanoyl-CoA dioxygenase family)
MRAYSASSGQVLDIFRLLLMKRSAMPMPILTSPQILSFNKGGYVVIKNFCNELETKKFLSAALINGSVMPETNASRAKKKQILWLNADDDGVLTNLTHSEKAVTSVAHLFNNDSPICHIQAKFIEKQPNNISSWAWHQDYAWWYMNGLLYPDQIMSFAVALTHSNKATGCSQVIKGSHKLVM